MIEISWLSSGMLRRAVSVVEIDQRFRDAYFLHNQGDHRMFYLRNYKTDFD
jgi:hypothetical protein